MKATAVLTLLLILVAAGLGARLYFESKGKSLEYPVHRTITSSDGRSLDVVILGRSQENLAIERLIDNEKFDLPIANLSAEDRAFVDQLEINRDDSADEMAKKGSKTKSSDEIYIQNRLDRIAELRSKHKAVVSEIESGSLTSLILRNRIQERDQILLEIEELQDAITQYKYRNRID